jgi:ABC-type lipoprotein release transport system permease subunit
VWTSVVGTPQADAALIQPAVLLPLCGVLVLITLFACLVPVRRAIRIDPATALRGA